MSSTVHTGIRIEEKTASKIFGISKKHKIKPSWLFRYFIRKGLEAYDLNELLQIADEDINARLGKDRKK